MRILFNATKVPLLCTLPRKSTSKKRIFIFLEKMLYYHPESKKSGFSGKNKILLLTIIDYHPHFCLDHRAAFEDDIHGSMLKPPPPIATFKGCAMRKLSTLPWPGSSNEASFPNWKTSCGQRHMGFSMQVSQNGWFIIKNPTING